ncbi:MAG TPA: caspase family protein, partial [Pseudomonadales bacterium]|nr:caspase family protein [Pseudomonadales bacterium]
TVTGSGVARALLIGINKYKAVPGLQGSVNDVQTMREILMTRWNFQPANIQMLLDEQATRANILAALEDLVAISGPDDVVYVHYSGHGSQVQDLNGDEEDGLDETIVPQDGRTDDVPDIVDDELDVIFSKLRAKSAVIVLDSCHSGTATRAFDIRARSVPQDTRIDLYRSGPTAVTTRSIVPVMQSKYVVMSGAASNQEALDGPVEGRYHGFFTYALSRSLTSAPANASPRQIFDGVESELGRIQTTFGRSSMPEPQLEAPPAALDAPLFSRAVPASAVAGAAQQPRLAWLGVRPQSGGDVTLVNGVLLGATPGSAWAIYPPNETQFAPGRAVAVATVTALDGNDARAHVDGAATIAADSRAVAALPAPASAHIGIRIGDVPADEVQRLKDLLSRHIDGVEWVGPRQPARFVVDMQGDTVRLSSADGLDVVGTFPIGDEQRLADVVRIASRTTHATQLLALDNPSSRMAVAVRALGAPNPKSRDIVLVANTAPVRLHARRSGEPRSAQNSLQLSIAVSEDAYLTIVDVDAEGTTNVLFPNSYQRGDFAQDGFVRAGREFLVPDSLQPGNRAGFYWDYSPPAGIDTVRVFATSDLATATTIRRRIAALQPTNTQSRGGDLATRAMPAGLAPLRTDLAQLTTRGIKVVADDSTGAAAPTPTTSSAGSDWTAASVTIAIEN